MVSRSILHWIIFIALAITWGSSFILMKRGLDAYPSDQVAALRISIAFLFLLPLVFRYLRKNEPKPWIWLACMGIFGNLIPAFLFTKAETMISSALTGMLNSLTPVFTLLLGVFLFQVKVVRYHIIGILIGLAGAVGLIAMGQTDLHPGNVFAGSALVVLATLFYGLSVNIIRAKLGQLNAVTATVLAMSIIGPIAIAYLATTDFLFRFQTHAQAHSSLLYIIILAVVGTALSVMIYNILIRETSALFASSVTYLIPIVAMSWGLNDGEEVGLVHLICIGIILAGVWLVNKKITS
jgi:drug/metabolite transporter (DMT)-like permease